jgi:hypothetical protein
MTTTYTHLNTGFTSTTDQPEPGLLLRIAIDGDNYMVRDFVGLRYGFANNVPQAIEMWASEVQWMLSEPREKLGGPALQEADAYRRALPLG